MVNGRVILLIGASGGVGSKIAMDLARAGHIMALHFHQNEAAANELLAKMDGEGLNATLFQANIADTKDVKRMIDEVMHEYGSIDVLINNAGVSLNGMSWKVTDADWQTTMDVNLTGPFYCIREVLPHMRAQQWGRVINITSIVGQTGFPGTVAYATSKSALIGMTKTLSLEVANKGISVNCLSLGYFKAGMLYTIPEEMREDIRQSIPVKEFGNTETISSTLRFLISDEAGYVTGQTINLNGGLH